MVITTHYARYAYSVLPKQIGCLALAPFDLRRLVGIRGRAGWPDLMINRQSSPPDLSYKTLTKWPHTKYILRTPFIPPFRIKPKRKSPWISSHW